MRESQRTRVRRTRESIRRKVNLVGESAEGDSRQRCEETQRVLSRPFVLILRSRDREGNVRNVAANLTTVVVKRHFVLALRPGADVNIGPADRPRRARKTAPSASPAASADDVVASSAIVATRHRLASELTRRHFAPNRDVSRDAHLAHQKRAGGNSCRFHRAVAESRSRDAVQSRYRIETAVSDDRAFPEPKQMQRQQSRAPVSRKLALRSPCLPVCL